MRSIPRLAGAIMLMAIVGFTLSIVAPSPARGAGSAPVTVVNGPEQPVPVTLQGTGSVAGTVNALQSGPWSVAVSSLPAVQLASGTTFNLNSSPDAPVYTDDLSVKQAFAASLCEGEGCTNDTVLVPVGKRLVIEYVSGTCRDNSGDPATFVISASLNGQTHNYFTSGVQGLVGSGDTNRIMIGAVTRIYADTSVSIARFAASTDQCLVTLSGHLMVIAPEFPG